MPEAVLVADGFDGDESALGQLKKHPDTRHARVVVVGSGDEIGLAWINPDDAMNAVRGQPYDVGVVVVDPSHADRLAFLHDLAVDEHLRELPPIAFIERELPRAQRVQLDALSKPAVITVADSPERLADRLALFLHRTEATLPAPTRKLLQMRAGFA